MIQLSRICVYCGSRMGALPAYREAAVRLGELLAERGIGLVYGGGHVGLMGVVADAALSRGGEVIGVIPAFLKAREVDHQRLTELRVVDSMHARKSEMAALADAFIALPGGIGTLEEMFEVWTWTQLGTHAKPVGLLNVHGFYDKLVAFLDSLVTQDFLTASNRNIVEVAEDPEDMLARLAAFRATAQPRWVSEEQT